MLAKQIETATRTASLSQLDHLAKQAWSAWGEGHLSDSDAETVTGAIEARRQGIRQQSHKNRSRGVMWHSKRPSSPDRRKSIARRRKQAASGVVPARLAHHFTTGQVAALTVIAREVKKHGRCTLPIDQIAALAGVCRTLVKDALHEARRLGLVNVVERPRPGRRSDTNIVEIISPEWRSWLRLSGDRGQKSNHHVRPVSFKPFSRPKDPPVKPTPAPPPIGGVQGNA